MFTPFQNTLSFFVMLPMCYLKPSLMFACFDACLIALTEAYKFSAMMLDGKILFTAY
jgi:hypothetical protein